MASIAVLPILIGLAVDYGDPVPVPGRGGARGGCSPASAGVSAERAVARPPGGAAPTIATAALATATGFLVLLLSPVPMVQGFGLLLVVGIAVALVCALTAGSAALVLAERDAARSGSQPPRRRRDRRPGGPRGGGDRRRRGAVAWRRCAARPVARRRAVGARAAGGRGGAHAASAR